MQCQSAASFHLITHRRPIQSQLYHQSLISLPKFQLPILHFHHAKMEPAFNLQPPSSSRRKNRAAADHLTLAPLTTFLPREEYDTSNTSSSRPHTSYIQGRSAPTTPVILSHSPPPPYRRPTRGVSVPYSPARAALTKSKSSSQLPKGSSSSSRRSQTDSSTGTTPTTAAAAAAARRRESVIPDTDFLLHVGALIASEARDAKGQGWLVTRASSTTSLPEAYAAYVSEDGLTPRERLFHHQQQRWQRTAVQSARTSRRGSKDYSGSADAAASAVAAATAASAFASPVHSHFGSHFGSRSRSRRPMTPAEVRRAELLASMEDDPQLAEDYFGQVAASSEAETPPLAGANFVGLDMELEFGPPEQDEDEKLAADEEYIRQLTQKKGLLVWIVDKMMGREDEEEEPEEEDYGEGDFDSWEDRERQRQARRSASLKRLREATVIPLDCTNDPPPKEDGGLWSDATWLLRVAANSFFP
ncbi:uncharacterized protein B0H64DRAFT_404626 [Chaetomium fimeti]|uniref:Uncharacterized protein n=1 Tax=Chaetomium fimeti TaxID=1854472 RepID=A0AAE0HBX5_9PEZI|nr:hypothetical protein B0H64DRAFT_404626 [Chaetomium fimeti]